MLDGQYAPHVMNSSGTDTGPSAVFFGDYDYDQLNERSLAPRWPPPPPPPQNYFNEDFSEDCHNLSRWVSNFADPNFSNADNYNFVSPTPELSLGPQHTPNWLLAHAMHTGDEEPLVGTMDTLARTLDLQSGPMEPTMSNSFQANDPEVLAAASTLSRTTAMGPSMSFPHGAMATDYSPVDHMPPGSHSTPRHDAGFAFTGTLGLSRPGPPFPSAPSRRVEAYFGTDTGFDQPRYQPRSHQDSLHIDSRHMAFLSCLTRIESAAPSRVPSPVDQGQHGPASGPPALFLQTGPSSARRREADHDEDEEPRGKRRKSSPAWVESPAGEAAVGDVLAERSPMLPTETQQRRRQSSAQSTNTGTRSTSRRNRASTTVPRRNLTEDERRHNHIESEARRRNQVTDAFAALRTLVPGLEKSKGLSRNNVLTSIGDWVTDLTAGNERLEALLDGPSPPPPP